MKLSYNTDRLYSLFIEHAALTDFELETMSGLNPNSVRGARAKLEDLGLIKRTQARKLAKDRGYYRVYVLTKALKPAYIQPMPKKHVVAYSRMIQQSAYQRYQANMEKLLARALTKISRLKA